MHKGGSVSRLQKSVRLVSAQQSTQGSHRERQWNGWLCSNLVRGSNWSQSTSRTLVGPTTSNYGPQHTCCHARACVSWSNRSSSPPHVTDMRWPPGRGTSHICGHARTALHALRMPATLDFTDEVTIESLLGPLPCQPAWHPTCTKAAVSLILCCCVERS